MIEQYDLSFLNLNNIKNTLFQIQTSTHGLVSKGVSTYNYGMPILDYEPLSGLKKIIQKHLELFTNFYSLPQVKLINSWFNISQVGNKLKAHKHEDSVVSGAFYLTSNVPLIFPETSISPYPGLLVLFSSDLIHYTEEETQERIVISFNTNLL